MIDVRQSRPFQVQRFIPAHEIIKLNQSNTCTTMKALNTFSLAFICLFLCCGVESKAMYQQTPEWAEDLELEFLTPRVMYSSLERPKLKLRVTNVSNEAIEYMGFDFRPDGSSQNFPGCATFPNGGFINLAPGESTIVSTWSGCYFGDGLAFEEGTTDHIAEFHFTRDNEIYMHQEEFQIVNDEGRSSPASPDGNDTMVSGVIRVKGGYLPQVRLYAKTIQSLPLLMETEPAGESGFAFSFPVQQGFEWYLQINATMEGETVVNFPRQTLKISDFEDPENIEIEIEALDYEYSVNFQLRDAIVTPTGFWRGAVSESEETVVFIPGQENWSGNSDEEKRVYREQSTIYKYNFAGEKLWEYQPGYECWGGDMTPDGSKVVYQLVPNGGTYGIGVLNGLTGELMWKKEFTEFNPTARAIEGLEAVLSNDGGLVAVGTVPTGVVSIFDAETGELLHQFPNAPDGEHNWGQIRAILFDSADEFLYVGSGDNHLRKIRMSDGQLMWKAFIGGWPFVNGLQFSSDESFLVTGTKSFDQARVDAETGETVWINDHGSLEAALSLTDKYVANFGGIIVDAETGEFLVNLHQGAETHFFAGDTLVAKLDRNIGTYYVNGKPLGSSEPSGGGQGGGEQSQWSYMKPDGSLAIIAYRDMVTDPGNQVGIAFYTGDIQRNTLDPNDSPTDISLSASSIDENNETDAEIGNFSTADADEEDTFEYELVDGEGDDDNGSFSISGDKLIVTSSLDFESKDTYSIRVRSSDSNEARISKVFEITVNDVNDAPTDIELDNNEINENEDSGTAIGDLSSTDDESNDTHTYTLVEGEGDDNNAMVSIDGTTLKTAASYDHEATSTLSIRVQTNDGNGGLYSKTLTINVNDINEAPTDITLSNSTILEGQAAGTEVGTLGAEDVDDGDTFTFTLVSGTGDTDNAEFDISGTGLMSKSEFTFATKSNYSIRVQVEDAGGETFQKEFTMTVEEDLVTSTEPDPMLVDNLYPNPATDQLTVEMATETYPFDLKMYDFAGNLQIHTDSILQKSITVDLRKLSKGIYILMIKDKTGALTRKKVIVMD